MNFKFIARERLAKQLAEDMAAVCPAGTVGLGFEDPALRRAVQKCLADKGLLNVYGAGGFPEHVRAIALEGNVSAADLEISADKHLFLVPKTLPATLFFGQVAQQTEAIYLTKEDAESRDARLAVGGFKTLLLFYLSAADRAMTSIADVSGEDSGAFLFLEDALAFIDEPPQKQNYIVRLTQLLKEGFKHFRAPFTRFAALTEGDGEGGFAELTFLASLLSRTAKLPFLKLLTLGSDRAETLYFLEECQPEIDLRVFGEQGVKRIARHVRLLVGKYSISDAELEPFFATVSAAVKISDGGFLSALKTEGVLQGFVKYPL